MGLFDGLDLLDANDRAEAVGRFTRANEEWADFCRRNPVTTDATVAEEAKHRVAEIESASRELYAAFDEAIKRM